MINTITLPPFKKMCVTIGNLPTSFVESMSYYEALYWMYNYLDKTVIPAINTEGEAITELQTAFTTLKTYVDNYFENLDVQEEINNKLDAMAESGELTDIIAQYLGLAGVLAFNTVADMIAGENLVNGSIARTLGYYNAEDGGGAFYKITDTADATKYQETLTSGLYATLIHLPNYINVKTIGCKADDNTFDNSEIINTAIKERTTLFFPYGEYFINNPIVITKSHVTIIGENERTRITKLTNNGTDITIETSKGTTYNLNNYDMNFYIGKATSESGTVSQVKIKNISIKCYDSTDTSYGVLLIGCGYFKTEDIQLIDYNRGIFIDDSFACNIDYIKALTFGSNRTAVEVKDSTAIYVSNSYLNARYYSIKTNNSRVYADNIACDAHGYVFLIENKSYFDMINSRCETYTNIISVDDSIVNVSNCDLEGHNDTFESILKANHNALINFRNNNIRYRVYDGETPPASINGFRSENSSIVNIESYLNILDGVTVNNLAQTGGSLFIIDLNKDGKKGTLTAETNVTITDQEVDIKDGYVNIYIAGNKSDGLTQSTSVNLATLSGIPIPSGHAFRGIAGTSADNLYSACNPAYVGINTSGVISIYTATASQKFFNINLRYKVK